MQRALRLRLTSGVLAVTGATCVLIALAGDVRDAPPQAVVPARYGPPAALPVAVTPAGPPTAASPQVGRAALAPSRPVTLRIPALDVVSTVREVGLARDGSIEVPPPGPRYDDAAWYRHSPTPGAIGPAVIIGHVDSAAGGPSVFFRLAELRAADRVSVERADGSTAVFVVDAVRRYPKDDFPTKVVYGDTARAELRLITCGGPFDRRSGHYKDNVVVFASLLQPRAAAG